MNTIYGTMVAIRIYHRKFLKTLKRTGFQINPYHPCVENFLLKNRQKTICFHVYNCKIKHQDSEVNDEFINKLHDEYEIVFKDGSGKMKAS